MSLSELGDAARARYLERVAALPPERRLLLALETSETARAFLEAGIRLRHPDATLRDVQARVALLLDGPAVAKRVYGFVPEGA